MVRVGSELQSPGSSGSGEKSSNFSEGGEDDNIWIIIYQCDPEFTADAELELEEALAKKVGVIVIDHRDLGERITAAIRLGNLVHKTAVLSGLACIFSASFGRLLPIDFYYFGLPAGLVSMACAAFYDLSWQSDPACKYQEDWEGTSLLDVPLENIESPSPVVLVRRDDTYRKILHNFMSLSAALFCGAKLYNVWQRISSRVGSRAAASPQVTVGMNI
eukprot:Clim_evm16s220 gene=Clim_evmTU16s220